MTSTTNHCCTDVRRAAAGFALAAAAAIAPAPCLADVSAGWVEPTTGVSIATDSAGNVYTVNYLYALGGEITLTKRDPDGGLLWEATSDNTQSPFWERATWVATDHDGNIVVTGTRMSGYSNPVNAASVIMKYAPDGGLLWRHVYESSFDGSSTRKCLVGDDNSIYVIGLGSGPGGFVTKVKKFAPDGAAIWSWFDDAGIGAPTNFKFTPDGFLAITGRGITGSVNGYAKISVGGATVWSLPGIQSLTVGDCAGDSSGNTYVVHGEYAVNGGTVVRKLDPSGGTLWSETFALSAFRIEVGSDDRAVACGFPNSGSGGAAFIKVDEGGELVWSNLDADGPLSLLLHAQLLLDQDNAAYLAAGTLFEMAVCKVDSDGSSAWTATVPGGYANAMAFGHDGTSVYVVGGTTARLDQTLLVAGDIDGDGAVDGADVGLLLAAWDTASPTADLNADGIVDGADLGILLAAWSG